MVLALGVLGVVASVFGSIQALDIHHLGGAFDWGRTPTGGWWGAMAVIWTLVALGGVVAMYWSPALATTLFAVAAMGGPLTNGGSWIFAAIILAAAAWIGLYAIKDPFADAKERERAAASARGQTTH